MSRTGTTLEAVKTLGPVPKTMRAGVYREKGIVRVEEVPVPEVGPGEVLIKVAACGICGTDIKKIFHAYVEPPQILGHELAGTVVAVGRGVTKWKLGDRVMSFHHVPCGKCFYCERRLFSQCKQYKTTGLTGGFTPNGGGFAEYVKAMPWVAERGIVALPSDVSFEEATFIEPINTILKAVQKARTDGRGADAVLVAVAHPSVVVDALAAARPGGRVLLFAANDPVTRIEFPASAIGVDEKEILGSYSAAVDIQEAGADLVLKKKLPVMDIVTHRFPLANIQQGLDLAAKPTAESLKILILHA